MKKVLLLAAVSIFATLPVFSEETKPRVAVLDPVINSTAIDDGFKSSMREIISSTIVNSGKYNIVERSLLDKIIQEQQFSNSGIVNENDAVEIGKLSGASKVVLSLVTPGGSNGLDFIRGQRNILSIKVIDVQTASVDRQKVQSVTAGNCLDITASLTAELVKDTTSSEQSQDNAKSTPVQAQPVETQAKEESGGFLLHLNAGYMPQNVAHKDNYIEVLINGNVVGGGTLSEGFNIRIKETKPKKYKLEFHPTSTSDSGKIDTKAGTTKFEIDTRLQHDFEFMIQSQRKGKWTIYSIRRK